MTYFLLRENYVIYFLDVDTFFDDVRITLYFGTFELRREISFWIYTLFFIRNVFSNSASALLNFFMNWASNVAYAERKKWWWWWWWWWWCRWWWWWWIVFVVWLTDERRLALFPSATIVRDPHHREPPTRRKQGLNSKRFNSRVWIARVLVAIIFSNQFY